MIRTFLALASAPVAGAASPPGGNHDGASGAHGQYDCYANGWAVDPDDVSAAVTVYGRSAADSCGSVCNPAGPASAQSFRAAPSAAS